MYKYSENFVESVRLFIVSCSTSWKMYEKRYKLHVILKLLKSKKYMKIICTTNDQNIVNENVLQY